MDISKLKQGWLTGIYTNEVGEIWSAPSRTCHEWRRLKTYVHFRDGYELLKVYDREAKKDVHISVHRYVCWAFNGPQPAAKPLVRHLDSNRLNNKVDNLCWGDAQENALDRRNRMLAPVADESFHVPA